MCGVEYSVTAYPAALRVRMVASTRNDLGLLSSPALLFLGKSADHEVAISRYC